MDGKHTSVDPRESLPTTENKRTWSPGTAAFLSFIIPGWGQMYKGHVKTGLIWLIVTLAGYFFMIIPGLLIHLICTLEAAYVKPNK